MELSSILTQIETAISQTNPLDRVLLDPPTLGIGLLIGMQLERSFVVEIKEVIESNRKPLEKILYILMLATYMILICYGITLIAEHSPIPISPTLLRCAIAIGFVIQLNAHNKANISETLSELPSEADQQGD